MSSLKIFLILILPGVDLLRVTVKRIMSGKNAFYGDRNHIHHLLNNRINLTLTNFVLILLSSFPVILFLYFQMKFYTVFFIFLLIYILLIYTLKIND